jgi:hypothetical protein
MPFNSQVICSLNRQESRAAIGRCDDIHYFSAGVSLCHMRRPFFVSLSPGNHSVKIAISRFVVINLNEHGCCDLLRTIFCGVRITSARDAPANPMTGQL